MEATKYRSNDFLESSKLFVEHLRESSKKRPSSRSRSKITAFIKNNARKHDVFFNIAKVSGRAIGYLMGILRCSRSAAKYDYAEVMELYVAQGFGNQGIAQQLLRQFFAWSRLKGVRKIVVEAETADNQATRFWAKRGFVRMWIVMQRMISRTT